jgi:hypothetical protein
LRFPVFPLPARVLVLAFIKKNEYAHVCIIARFCKAVKDKNECAHLLMSPKAVAWLPIEPAGEKEFDHQHERISFAALKFLLQNVGRNRHHLRHWNHTTYESGPPFSKLDFISVTALCVHPDMRQNVAKRLMRFFSRRRD